MTDSQHDFVIFILIALVGGAVLGAIVTLSGCGGAEFTGISERPDVGAEPKIGMAPEILALPPDDATAIRDAHTIMRDTYNASPANTPDASPVEPIEEDAKVDAISNSCDIDACNPHCPGNNLPCCTTAGACGCHDFGPACVIP